VPPVGGLVWQLPNSSSSSSSSQPALMVWLGPFNSPALTHLQLTYSTSPWLLLDPASCTAEQGLLPDLQRLLKRRYYLVERARAASMVGLLVGTLGAAGYLEALSRVRQLAAEVSCRWHATL
jgi:diphthamide biosynthesis protein 2